MKGLKDEPTARTIIDGFRIYYNFIRPHMALNGKTPAEMAGINLQLGQNKWESLIRQSSKHKKEAVS
jgi:hypothetical protein